MVYRSVLSEYVETRTMVNTPERAQDTVGCTPSVLQQDHACVISWLSKADGVHVMLITLFCFPWYHTETHKYKSVIILRNAIAPLANAMGHKLCRKKLRSMYTVGFKCIDCDASTNVRESLGHVHTCLMWSAATSLRSRLASGLWSTNAMVTRKSNAVQCSQTTKRRYSLQR